MKVLPSIAFGDFSGSAGDVTARSIGGRTILNHKAYQAKTKTPAQSAEAKSVLGTKSALSLPRATVSAVPTARLQSSSILRLPSPRPSLSRATTTTSMALLQLVLPRCS